MTAKLARLPKYLELKNWLQAGILEGRFVAGSCLPSENELSQRFEISRITVRQALHLLVECGLVTSHQGKGHVVRSLRAVQNLGRLQGFGEMMEPMGVAAHSRVLDAAVVAAPAEVARALRIKRGDPVVKIERLRIAASVTMSMDISYFPPDIGNALMELDLQHVDVFKLIETRLGIPIGFADITMSIVPASEAVRAHMPLAPGEPVIHIERLTHTIDCRPIDFEMLYATPDSHSFKVRIPRW